MTSHRMVFVVPHTHWDREWYEPLGRFRQRLVAMMDDLIEWLESGACDGPVLLDGQTVLLRDYVAVRPDQALRLRSLVEQGRVLVGPWYVLTDELLPSGETLIRNLLFGRRDGADWGGWMDVGYSPDAFGHPAALPTILSGFGISHVVLWRGYGGEPGQEHDLFRWRAADGSTVTVHHLPPVGYEIGRNLPSEHEALGERWRELQAVFDERASYPRWLLLSGADHHRIPRNLPDVLEGLQRIDGDTAFVLASPQAYFSAIPAHAVLPEVEGELRHSYRYTWTLQGVHAVRARLKHAIAEGECLLTRWAEPQASLAVLEGAPDRRPLLELAWRTHVENCFHDTIAGCTSDRVARDAACRAARVATEARGILVDALHDRLALDRSDARQFTNEWQPALAVVNPSARARSGVVEATVTIAQDRVTVGRRMSSRSMPATWPAPPVLLSTAGTPVPVQVLAAYEGYERLDSPHDYPLQHTVAAFRVAVWITDVPALGLTTLRTAGPTSAAQVPDPVWVSGNRAVASWCTLDADSDGGFRFHDRETDGRFPMQAVLRSERDSGDTYTFQPASTPRPERAAWGPAQTIWTGPLIAAVAREFRIGRRVSGTLYARLDAGSRLVRYVVEGVNQAGNHRLRIVFPFPRGARARGCRADMTFGPVERQPQNFREADYPSEWPVRTAPMHRWISVPNVVTLFARGLYEYELLPEGGIAVTLFRAVGDLSRDDLRARPGHAAWPEATPDAQELGPFRAELAVTAGPMASAAQASVDDEIERLAEEFHDPLSGLMLSYAGDVPNTVAGPRLDGDGLKFEALKSAELGSAIVLRCVNVSDRPSKGSWTFPWSIRSARGARLDETPLAVLRVTANGHRVTFTAEPREVVTVLVERRS